ncbi:DUF3422 family protein [Qingshengfaniella alkalisoli]|uniref:DUF3422 domain-containing protein n=1 Tax=Qingshengfaniella alkalisoli TaxID=2599296 RepID=A0A5B8IT44_9RHOB|nr:DUF3422 domain-containing protein [Qingshengfaniella alkalisoli]QDY69422.1 DUF3422 domain-containing protein [Qingshengfaniella alkalisoli]
MRDNPFRFELTNELHARPFPTLKAPAQVIYLAIKTRNEGLRDHQAEQRHLFDLLDHFGAAKPDPDVTHYSGQLGRYRLKWESHTEFVSYTVMIDNEDLGFETPLTRVFPADWLAGAPGERISSAIIHIGLADDPAQIRTFVDHHFVSESLAVSSVLDGAAVIAGDFRTDAAGNKRMAIFVPPETGPNRIGRIMQRLTEIETYTTMSMLGLAMTRRVSPELTRIDGALARVAEEMAKAESDPEDTLQALLQIGADLEHLAGQNNFRFGATGAYAAIVNQRIEVLHEDRFEGRQTMGEFMMRRFDPAMRTVQSTERRVSDLAQRSMRAGNLLRTRVDVERSAQNQSLLESMDRRAAMQLRLQHTVEGLSVVAISYYALNLVLYLTGPLEKVLGLGKTELAAGATPIVVLLVWLLVSRIRKHLE